MAKKKSGPLQEVSKSVGGIMTTSLIILSIIFMIPIGLVFMNALKNKLYISSNPFAFPLDQMYAGFENFINGIEKTGFLKAAGNSLFITVFSVLAIIFFTSMTAWWITRVKNKFTTSLYYLFVFAMIVPFQMVMFTLSKMTDILSLNTPWGIIPVYVGFGAGLCVFMFSGFVKSIPISLEEAAMIDGCNPVQTFFLIVFPVLKPTVITVAILQTMWIWNDYLLPKLVLSSDYQTIPVAVQYLRGGYGSVDMGALMAMLVLAIVPIIIFYLTSQKYIIKGIAAGAVKG